MPYPLLRTGILTIDSQMFDLDNGAEAFPEGTTFSANTSDFNIATALADSSGVVVVTPQGGVTGNVYINLTATLPDNGGAITGSLMVHVMDSPLSTKKWIELTPQN